MRTGGVSLSPIGGHWRDLLDWRARIPELGFTLDTSHAALFRSFAVAYASLYAYGDADELDLSRYVEELGPAAEVAHVSNAHGILGEGLPYGTGDLDLDPSVRRLAALVPFIVAEISEPDPMDSTSMKAGYRAIERVIASPEELPMPRPRRRLRPERFNWERVLGQPDPVPSVLELQELVGGRRVLITGGGGSIASSLAALLLGFRPEIVTLLDSHEASLTSDRRSRDSLELVRIEHVLCDIRDHGRVDAEIGRARPHLIFHLAAYKHVDWAEIYPDEFLDTNLHGSWNVLRAASATRSTPWWSPRRTRRRRRRATTGAPSASWSSRRRTPQGMTGRSERPSASSTCWAARGARLTSSCARHARACPHGHRHRHAPLLDHHGPCRDGGGPWALLAAQGTRLATPAGAPELTVGELAARIWRSAGLDGEPNVELLGIRRGETMAEVLTGAGERLGAELYPGIVEIEAEVSTDAASWVAERIGAETSREAAREVWREAMGRPGLIVPV